jgi:hypothetical protein
MVLLASLNKVRFNVGLYHDIFLSHPKIFKIGLS